MFNWGNRRRAVVSNATFEFIHQLGMTINDPSIVTVSGGGEYVTVRDVVFENCVFARDVHQNAAFVNCEFKNCDLSDTNWVG